MCRMATIDPMKPRAAEQIPTEDQILISSNQSFVNSKKKIEGQKQFQNKVLIISKESIFELWIKN